MAEAMNFVRERLRHPQRGVLDPPYYNPGVVMIKNTTATDWDRHDCVYIDKPTIEPVASANAPETLEFRSFRVFDAIEPLSGETHVGKIAILLEPIPAGRMGAAILSGVVNTKIDVIDEDDEFCDVDETSGGRLLTSNSDYESSGQILWKASGTGEKWATVRLSNKKTPALEVGFCLGASHPDGVSAMQTLGSGELIDFELYSEMDEVQAGYARVMDEPGWTWQAGYEDGYGYDDVWVCDIRGWYLWSLSIKASASQGQNAVIFGMESSGLGNPSESLGYYSGSSNDEQRYQFSSILPFGVGQTFGVRGSHAYIFAWTLYCCRVATRVYPL
jgi:hypothetical protein